MFLISLYENRFELVNKLLLELGYILTVGTHQ